jgi:hypothetical protein
LNISDRSTASVSTADSKADSSKPLLVKTESTPQTFNRQNSAFPTHLKPVAASTPIRKGKDPGLSSIEGRDHFDSADGTSSFNKNACNISTTPLNNQPQLQQNVTPRISDKAPNPQETGPLESEIDVGDQYNFPSEDDAFLAGLAELEADLGRPIDYENETTTDLEHQRANFGAVQQPPQQHRTTTAVKNSIPPSTGSNHSVTTSRPLQNHNLPSRGQTKSNSGLNVQRPLGGFNFPPGVVSTSISSSLSSCLS